MHFIRIKEHWQRGLDDARLRLAHPDALLHLALLGLAAGLAAGGVIVLFRYVVEGAQVLMLPGGDQENYEALAWWQRLVLPILGAGVLALMFRYAANGSYVLGVTKVLERMAYHQGRMDWRGFFLQFVGAAAALVSGHSVGREGPHVYLGAASGSLLGQHLTLPYNAIRTLVACGTAAGIAASFNTPLAGVIFSLEVVMMEYTVASFIPVILAAVSATALSNAIFGAEPAFQVNLTLGSLAEMPVVLVLGFAVGGLSALFNHLVERIAHWGRPVAIWWRVMLAGLVVGLCGIWVPQVMGIGYDTVREVLDGHLLLEVLLLVLLVKVFATSVAIGLGVPGGMIGPTLFMGAILGGIAGLAAEHLIPGMQSSPGFYALIGLGTMMGASLQAPLAALTAMVELTHNPAIIMPGMLAIVVASLTCSQLFGKESLFLATLKANGMDYDTNPMLQAMRRIGVASIMNRRFKRTPARLPVADAGALLDGAPDWLVIDSDDDARFLMPAVDLARYLEESEGEVIALMEIPAQRMQLAPIHHQATLQEAMERLKASGAEAIYVEQGSVPGLKRVQGILTRGRIESAYRV